MMKTIYENEFIRIMIDDETPIIYSEILSMPKNSITFRKGFDIHIHLINAMLMKYSSGVYSICDAQRLQSFSFDILVQYFLDLLPKQMEKGLTFKAFVKPACFTSLDSLHEIIKSFGNLPIGIFETQFQAKSFVMSEQVNAGLVSERAL